MKKLCRFIVSVNLIIGMLPNLSEAQKCEKCIFFYKASTSSVENNLYMKINQKFDYKEQYDNLKKANIKSDLALALIHRDYRFIAISGNSLLLPDLMGDEKYNGVRGFGVLKQYNKVLNKHNYKVVCGTSDAIDEGSPDLQGQAFNYAKKYNKLLLEKLGYIKQNSR